MKLPQGSRRIQRREGTGLEGGQERYPYGNLSSGRGEQERAVAQEVSKSTAVTGRASQSIFLSRSPQEA